MAAQDQPERHAPEGDSPEPIALADAELRMLATMTRGITNALLEAHDPRNRHLARATLDASAWGRSMMYQAMGRLERAVRRYAPDPPAHPPNPETNAITEEVDDLRDRLERHLRNTFRAEPEQTEESVWLMLAIPFQGWRDGIKLLLDNAEAMDPDDPRQDAERWAAGTGAHIALTIWQQMNLTEQETTEPLSKTRKEWAQTTQSAVNEIEILVPPEERHRPSEYMPPMYSEDGRRATVAPDTEAPTATRYHDRARRIYDAEDGTNPYRAHLKKMLNDDTVSRILFDGRQAAVFRDMADLPGNMQQMLRLPFDQFYLEPNSPIWLDVALKEYRVVTLRGMMIDGIRPHQEMGAAEGTVGVHAFIEMEDQGSMSVGFIYDLNDGQSYIPAAALRQTVIDADRYDTPFLPCPVHDSVDDEDWIIAGPEEGAVMGSVDEIAWRCGALLGWMLAYMMSKSIEVVPEPVTRQQRRRAERKGQPLPWHIVQVEPKLREARETEGYAPHSGPSVRHMVIGHIRLGRHRLKDGTYSENWEWVRPHMRGLANSRFVPKISKFSGSRRIHPKMRDYWGRSPDGKENGEEGS